MTVCTPIFRSRGVGSVWTSPTELCATSTDCCLVFYTALVSASLSLRFGFFRQFSFNTYIAGGALAVTLSCFSCARELLSINYTPALFLLRTRSC